MAHDLPDLSGLARPGTTITVRASAGARQNAIVDDGGTLRVMVTAPPEDGKANEAIRRLLAKALGVAPSRLALVRGATAREKVFRIEE